MYSGIFSILDDAEDRRSKAWNIDLTKDSSLRTQSKEHQIIAFSVLILSGKEIIVFSAKQLFRPEKPGTTSYMLSHPCSRDFARVLSRD